MTDLKSCSLTENEDFVKSLKQPSFRARQIFSWAVRGVGSFDGMTDIPLALRSALAGEFYLSSAEILRKQVSAIDGTVKYLFRLCDGNTVETAVMKYHHGYTVCVSTQVGCRMNCGFCASAAGGFTRDLTAGEMLCQIWAASRDLNVRVSNAVLMGMGEPLDNLPAVLRFLALAGEPEGLHIGARHISVSTCGLADKIRELAEYKLQITLSVSLHAPNDVIRDRLMPVNRRFPVDELLCACKFYFDRTSRRVSFEYMLISGVNDSDECAGELLHKLKGENCHINLIPANPARDEVYKSPGRERLERFREILTSGGLTATVRRTLGADIDAACGQLKQLTANNANHE